MYSSIGFQPQHPEPGLGPQEKAPPALPAAVLRKMPILLNTCAVFFDAQFGHTGLSPFAFSSIVA
jgi:hypothetical protein